MAVHIIRLIVPLIIRMDKNKRNNPGDYLKRMLGREVEVKLNDNHTFFIGVMTCLDGNDNVLLSNAK